MFKACKWPRESSAFKASFLLAGECHGALVNSVFAMEYVSSRCTLDIERSRHYKPLVDVNEACQHAHNCS
jgi:hypothetical protein